MVTHSSILSPAAWWATVHGVERVRYDLSFSLYKHRVSFFPLNISPDCRSSWVRLSLRTGGGLDKCLESRAQVINSLLFPFLLPCPAPCPPTPQLPGSPRVLCLSPPSVPESQKAVFTFSESRVPSAALAGCLKPQRLVRSASRSGVLVAPGYPLRAVCTWPEGGSVTMAT